MRQRPVATVIAGIVALTAIACRDASTAEPAAPAAPAAAPDPWDTTTAPPPADPGPRTIEHGAEARVYTVQDLGSPTDRRVLRYKLRPGTRNDFEIALEMMTYSAWHPRVTMYGTSEITEVDDRGLIHAHDRVDRIVVERGRSDGAAVAEQQAIYDRVVGLTVDSVFDARGIQERETIHLPHGDLDQDVIDRLVWHLGVPSWLPDEPVGVGARWTKTQTINHPDYTTARTATSEVVSHRGDLVEIRGTASDSGAQSDGVSSTANGEFAGVTDLTTLRGAGDNSLHGEYHFSYLGEPRVVKGATEAHTVVRGSTRL